MLKDGVCLMWVHRVLSMLGVLCSSGWRMFNVGSPCGKHVLSTLFFMTAYVTSLQLTSEKRDLQVSKQAAYAVGTRQNLRIQWESFLTFCIYFGFNALPASLSTVCLYAQFLSRSFKSVSSIKNYINGIKNMHLFHNVPFPHIGSFELNITFRGIARLNPH